MIVLAPKPVTGEEAITKSVTMVKRIGNNREETITNR